MCPDSLIEFKAPHGVELDEKAGPLGNTVSGTQR